MDLVGEGFRIRLRHLGQRPEITLPYSGRSHCRIRTSACVTPPKRIVSPQRSHSSHDCFLCLPVQLEADAGPHGEISLLAGYDLYGCSVAASHQEKSINLPFVQTGDSSMTRILGIDFGTRRVGIALSDPGRTMAFPIEVHEPRGPEHDAHYYRELVRENEIELHHRRPPATHQRPRERPRLPRPQVRRMAIHGNQSSSRLFRRALLDGRSRAKPARRRALTRKKRQAQRDKLAAQIHVLQGYLDAGCPRKEVALTPLSDHLIPVERAATTPPHAGSSGL